MKRVEPQDDWPPAWMAMYHADVQEIWAPEGRRGPVLGYRNRLKTITALVQKHLQTGSRVLDVAAAQGNVTFALAESGYAVTWNDIKSDIDGYVRLKEDGGQVDYRSGNAFDLNLPGKPGEVQRSNDWLF